MTNFEKVKENLTIQKMAFLMLNVPNFCPFTFGCDKCAYYDENNLALCFAKANWTERDYIEWLESEAIKNDKQGTNKQDEQ